MKLFNKVAIVGVGLMGGSIGMAVKKKRIANYVLGFEKRRSSIFKAKDIGAIDVGIKDLKKLEDCDLVILACPVITNIWLSKKIIPLLRRGAILVDVSSTKKEIVSEIKRVKNLNIDFIGCHPLAGSEKKGVINARDDLFRDSLCILTPSPSTKKENLNRIIKFWSQLGAETQILSPERHDLILSLVSHLPHAVSFSLIKSIPKKYFKFASGSLKDMTRVVSSDSTLWCDIFLTNQKYILKAIEGFQKSLEDFKRTIRKKNRRRLFRILETTKLKRDAL